MGSENEWFREFFDEIYYDTYRVFEDEERNERETKFIADALGLPAGSRILDLGCGYARHAVYLAKWGYHVVCFDLSKYLLEKARARIEEYGVQDRVEIVEGDMRSLDYHEEFDGVYMFFTVFGYFSDEENSEVLRRVARALKTGGRLLIDHLNLARVLNDFYASGGIKRTWHEAGEYLVLEESRIDVRQGRITTNRIFYKKGRLAAERSFSLRVYPYWELKSMLEHAGMRIVKDYGTTRGDEYTVSSPRMIIVAEHRSM